MSSTSGGTPASQRGTSAVELMGDPNQLTKKRKADLLTSPSKEGQQIADNQLKLKNLIQEAMKVVTDLNATLGTKAKTETRSHAEKLNLLMETIKETSLLDFLGSVVTTKTPEMMNETKDEMDLDETMSSSSATNEILCTRCKQVIFNEKQLSEEIRVFVQEFHITECETFSPKDKNIFNKKWPEESFLKSKEIIGNPLLEATGDILLALKIRPISPTFLQSSKKDILN